MEFRTYHEAAKYLNSLLDYEKLLSGPIIYDTKAFDRQRFRSLLRDLGNPHLKYPVIHVAGTKGKGSTCAFLQGALTESKLKTGLYTSPHIASYRERIAIDGELIPEDRFCALLAQLANHLAEEPKPKKSEGSQSGFRTVFEHMTAVGFLYFAERKVDVAVIETGLGGRLDSTNVFDDPAAPSLVSVITPIGFDHTAILGDTIPRIATEKIGILKRHGVTVIGPQPAAWSAEVIEVVEERLRDLGQKDYLDASELIKYEEVLEEEPGKEQPAGMIVGRFQLSPDATIPTFPLAKALGKGMTLESHLPGVHQLENLRTVLAALLAFESAGGPGPGRNISPEGVKRGIAMTRWPGRIEIVSQKPVVIIDGAHCPMSAEALGRTFLASFGQRPVVLVAGFMRDKDPIAMCQVLDETINIQAVICCSPPSPRALPAEEAADNLRQVLHVPVEPVPSPLEAMRLAMNLREGNQAVIVFGSIYLIQPAKDGWDQYSEENNMETTAPPGSLKVV